MFIRFKFDYDPDEIDGYLDYHDIENPDFYYEDYQNLGTRHLDAKSRWDKLYEDEITGHFGANEDEDFVEEKVEVIKNEGIPALRKY